MLNWGCPDQRGDPILLEGYCTKKGGSEPNAILLLAGFDVYCISIVIQQSECAPFWRGCQVTIPCSPPAGPVNGLSGGTHQSSFVSQSKSYRNSAASSFVVNLFFTSIWREVVIAMMLRRVVCTIPVWEPFCFSEKCYIYNHQGPVEAQLKMVVFQVWHNVTWPRKLSIWVQPEKHVG